MPDLSRRALLASACAVALVSPLRPVASAPVDLAPGSPPAPRLPPTLIELKGWSERALVVLQRHYPDQIWGEVFLAEPDEGYGYHGLRIRCDCPDVSERWGCTRCALASPGTPMIGGVTGYFEPEWDETTAYGLLSDIVRWEEKPPAMTDAEWAEALAIVGMTPASHAEQMANWEREMREADVCGPDWARAGGAAGREALSL